MKNKIIALKFPAFFLLFVITFIACDRDFNVIESDVLGKGNTNFTTNDTIISVLAYNKKLDSLQINNLASNLFGIFNDPAYGKTTASIVTQITPVFYNPDFGIDPVIDSVVVNIPYFSTVIGVDDEGNTTYSLDSIYGNQTSEIKLTIYQNNYFLRDFDPTSELNSTQNFYSNANSTSNSVFTGNSIVNFDDHIVTTIHEDTVFLPSAEAIELWTISDGDTTKTRSAPAYRVVLNDPEDILYWKNTILEREGTSDLSNSNNFYNYFRGLYIKAESVSSDGNMILLNLNSSSANISIYYTKGIAEARTQSNYNFTFNGKKLNTFINDYNLINLQNGDKTFGDEKLYLKGTSGSMGVIDLFENEQGLENFISRYRVSDGNGGYEKDTSTGLYILKRLINEAHLEIYEDETINTGSFGSDFHRFDRIYAYDIKNNSPTVDYQLDPTENNSAFSSKIISLGQRDTISGKYKIRLTEHLNSILLRDSTNTKIGLVLSNNVNYNVTNEILNSNDDVTEFPPAAIISPRGTIIHGSNSNVPENKKLKLKIFFTEPNQN